MLNVIKKEIKNSIFAGITAMTVQVKNALEISDFIKENDPSIPIIWGGTHPYLFPKPTAMDKSVDILVIREGEHTMLELVKHFENGGSLNDIDGIAYIDKNKEFIQTKPRKLMNMNELESIKWNLLPKIVLNNLKKGGGYVHTSRGCPHRCTFCINIVKMNPFRARSAEKVLKDLEDVEKIGIKYFRFRDECFFVNAKRVKKIAEGMIERGMDFEWNGSIRVDYFKPNHINDRILKKIKKAGCISFNIGIESGSQRVLDILKKDITIEEALNSARVCKKFDITPYYSFMIGVPGETKEDMMKTINIIDKLKHIWPKSGISGPQVFRPYPGGELYEKALEFGWEEPQTLRGWVEKSMKDSIFASAWDLPWIEDPDFIETVSYSPLWTKGFKVVLKGKTPRLKVLTAMFLLISRFRWKSKFFGFPVDTKIRNFLNKYKDRI